MDLLGWLHNENDDLYLLAMNVRKVVKPILERPRHLDYTDHSVSHSERVIEKLSKMTEGLMARDPLSPVEAYILLAAAYLHDIGMQDELSGSADLQWMRDQHNKLGATRILESIEWFRTREPLAVPLFPDAEIGAIVAKVVEAHRGAVDLSDPKYEPSPYGAQKIRPRLLAALLRFGDELDTDFRRAPLDALALSDISPESLFHWYKCHYVKAVQIEDEYIEVWYRFPEGHTDYSHIIQPLVDGKMRDEFDELQGVFGEYHVKLRLGPSKLVEIPHLQPMPPEVEAFARKECIKLHETKIRQRADEISYIQSPSEGRIVLETADV